jgi:hypothetical protein
MTVGMFVRCERLLNIPTTAAGNVLEPENSFTAVEGMAPIIYDIYKTLL